MKANASLTGVLPKIFNRDNVDQRRLGELVDLRQRRPLHRSRRQDRP